MDVQSEFIQNIFKYLTNHLPNNSGNRLIKKESTQNLLHGDFSFPADLSIWKQYILIDDNDHADILIAGLKNMPESEGQEKCSLQKEKQIQKLIEISKNWHLQISKIILKHYRYFLVLNRNLCFERIIEMYIENKQYDKMIINNSIGLKSINDDRTSISNYRCKLVEMVIVNMLTKYTSCQGLASRPDVTIVVTYKSTCPLYDSVKEHKRKVLCGIVNDFKNNNKIADITADQYIELD